MSNLYKVLAKLCEEKGISGYKMCKDLGIQPSVMTDLKMGRRSSVKAETASRIANYFSVSVDYLLGREDEKKTTPYLTLGGGQNDPDIRRIERARNNMTPNDRDRMMIILKTAFNDYFDDDFKDDDTDE